MSDPVIPSGQRPEDITVVEYAEIFGLSLDRIKASGPDGRHVHADVDRAFAERNAAVPATPLVRMLAATRNVNLAAVTGTGAGGRIGKRDVLAAAPHAGSPLSPRPRHRNELSAVAADQPIVTTLDQQNAAIEADPDYHRGLWALGVRDGLKPPPERFTVCPVIDVPWDPQPELVIHPDGTGHYETPKVDTKWLGTQGPRRTSRTGSRTANE